MLLSYVQVISVFIHYYNIKYILFLGINFCVYSTCAERGCVADHVTKGTTINAPTICFDELQSANDLAFLINLIVNTGR